MDQGSFSSFNCRTNEGGEGIGVNGALKREGGRYKTTAGWNSMEGSKRNVFHSGNSFSHSHRRADSDAVEYSLSGVQLVAERVLIVISGGERGGVR